jgi:hypothetical protein
MQRGKDMEIIVAIISFVATVVGLIVGIFELREYLKKKRFSEEPMQKEINVEAKLAYTPPESLSTDLFRSFASERILKPNTKFNQTLLRRCHEIFLCWMQAGRLD